MTDRVSIGNGSGVAPTPVNTPLNNTAPISSGLSRPTVPDITEEDGDLEEGDIDTDAHAIQQAMLGMVHGKLSNLIGKSSGYIEALPVEVKKSVEALKGIQVKQVDLQNQYKRECLELEKKYLEKTKPLYERRNALISGTSEPTTEEVDEGEKQSTKDDEEYTPLPKDTASSSSGIPEFWLTALRNHIGLSEIITDRDADALKSLVDLRLTYLPDKPGFTLIFTFKSNEFFSNETLEKTYIYQEEVGYGGDFVYDKAVGTEIKWKDDHDLTKEYEVKKQRNKNTNRTRLVRKAKPTESFFNFFTPPALPSPEDLESGDLDDEEIEEIEAKLEIDYQIGEDLKEKIIPRAVDYFTGKALEYDMDDEDDFEDFDDDEDDEDDDDDEFDDSDSEPELQASRRRGPPKGRGAGAPNVNPEECKQQ